MAAVDDNIITFKYVVFIILTVKKQTWRRHLVRTNKNKTSIFRTQRRFFFPLSSLTAAKSAMRNWTVNFRLSLTSLSSIAEKLDALQILTADTIKVRKFCTIHLLILDVFYGGGG